MASNRRRRQGVDGAKDIPWEKKKEGMMESKKNITRPLHLTREKENRVSICVAEGTLFEL